MTVDAHHIVYVDEAGIDQRNDYPYGYSEIGQRFEALKSGMRKERISWIAALREQQLFGPLTFTGSYNRVLFEQWLSECLIPQLSAGDVIVIDNASFHYSSSIGLMVKEAGCELWDLPPYSPDLNDIENWWSVTQELDAAALGGV